MPDGFGYILLVGLILLILLIGLANAPGYPDEEE